MPVFLASLLLGCTSPDTEVSTETPSTQSTDVVETEAAEPAEPNEAQAADIEAELEVPPQLLQDVRQHCAVMQQLSQQKVNDVAGLSSTASGLLRTVAQWPALDELVEPIGAFIEYASWMDEARKVESALYAINLEDNKGVSSKKALERAVAWDTKRGDDLRVSSFEATRETGTRFVPARPQASSSIETLYITACARAAAS